MKFLLLTREWLFTAKKKPEWTKHYFDTKEERQAFSDKEKRKLRLLHCWEAGIDTDRINEKELE